MTRACTGSSSLRVGSACLQSGATCRPQAQGLTATKLKAHGSVLAVQAVFAAWYLVGHAVLSEGDPLVFALAREILSSVSLLLLARSIDGPIQIKDRRDILDIIVVGLLCYGSVIGFMFALAELPEVQVAIAQPLLPALSLAMSAAAGLEKLSLVSGLGILMCIGGAIEFTALSSGAEGGEGASHVFGYVMLALELLSYAAQLVYLPRISRKYSPITLTSLYYCVASVASLVTLVIRESDQLANLPHEAQYLAQPLVAGGLLFAVAGPTVYSYTALSWSSTKLEPSVTSSYMTLQPVFVAVLSFLLYGTVLSRGEIGSGAVVILGLYLSVIGNPRMDRQWAEYVKNLPETLPETIDNVTTAGADAVSTVADISATALTTVADAGSDALENVADAGSSALESVTDAGSSAMDTMAEALVGAGQRAGPSGNGAGSELQRVRHRDVERDEEASLPRRH